MNLLLALAIGGLFGTGVHQLLRRSVVRSAIGLVILSNAMNLLLLATGAYDGAVAAYATLQGTHSDALPQALILTAIVISMGGFSFVLALLLLLSARHRSGDIDRFTELRH